MASKWINNLYIVTSLEFLLKFNGICSELTWKQNFDSSVCDASKRALLFATFAISNVILSFNFSFRFFHLRTLSHALVLLSSLKIRFFPNERISLLFCALHRMLSVVYRKTINAARRHLRWRIRERSEKRRPSALSQAFSSWVILDWYGWQGASSHQYVVILEYHVCVGA